MHCVSAYPCEAKNINLPRIEHLRQYFDHVGFSDHTQGIKTTISSTNLSPVAIEKHFTIDKTLPKSADHWLSVDPMELKSLVENRKNTSIYKTSNMFSTAHSVSAVNSTISISQLLVQIFFY